MRSQPNRRANWSALDSHQPPVRADIEFSIADLLNNKPPDKACSTPGLNTQPSTAEESPSECVREPDPGLSKELPFQLLFGDHAP